jgi:hypothetical protein
MVVVELDLVDFGGMDDSVPGYSIPHMHYIHHIPTLPHLYY